MKFYKASANVNLNWSKFNSLRANLLIRLILWLISYKLQNRLLKARGSLGTQFKVWPNLEVRYSTLNDYQNTVFKTKQPFAKLDYLFLKSFSFTADYNNYNYSNSQAVNNKYEFLNASLSYRKRCENGIRLAQRIC
jgi:hypothetical protein